MTRKDLEIQFKLETGYYPDNVYYSKWVPWLETKLMEMYEAYPFKKDFLKNTFTCDNCIEKEYCEFKYDPYNTNGDCLANK